VLFLLFGLWLLFETALKWHVMALTSTGIVAVAAIAAGSVSIARARRARHEAPAQREPSPEPTTPGAGYPGVRD